MRGAPTAAVLACALAGCLAHDAWRAAAPLEREGELHVYLQPLPRGAERLALGLASVEALSTTGETVPLRLIAPDVSGAEAPAQRLLARGRLAPGSYAGLLLRFRSARLVAPRGASDLPVAAEPRRVDSPFAVAARRAVVLALTLETPRPPEAGTAFEPRLAAAVGRMPLPQRAAFCSDAAGHALAVVDKHDRQVVGVLPTGRGPEGLALDARPSRVYLALSGEDQVAVVDVGTGDEVLRFPLRPGDRPREVALSADGRTLVVTNPGSSSVAFLDASSGMELGRIDTGQAPGPLLLDRGGQRGYVLNQVSLTLTAFDVRSRTVTATASTEAQPVRAGLNRAGTRLYVAHAASPNVAVLSLPTLAPAGRLVVGAGAGALLVDSRTDLVYVASRDRGRVQIFDPFSLMPVSEIEVPAPVTRMAIDDAENALFALMPAARAVAVVDLSTGRQSASFDVGEAPYQLTMAGERR